ncbi:MAG: DUF1361 domain-containing protein [Armatimonadetes bacterium]|nr:DUF1361 domain-containing protein [Armatimonadota bacterium]
MAPETLRSMAINVGLAFAPVALGLLVAAALGGGKRGPGRVALALLVGVVWLAFLPNTCYLLTEWRHLLLSGHWSQLADGGADDRAALLSAARWALFYTAYSGIGMLCLILAIRPVDMALKLRGFWRGLLGLLLFSAMSIGVYLGLIERYNSWDLVMRPMQVGHTIKHAVTSPTLAISMGVLAIALWIAYSAADVWAVGLRASLGKKARNA